MEKLSDVLNKIKDRVKDLECMDAISLVVDDRKIARNDGYADTDLFGGSGWLPKIYCTDA